MKGIKKGGKERMKNRKIERKKKEKELFSHSISNIVCYI